MINFLINGEPVNKTTTPVYSPNTVTGPVSCNYSNCDDAFDSGFGEGYEQGHEDGFADGYAKAKADHKAAEDMYRNSLKSYIDSDKAKFVKGSTDIAYVADIKVAPKVEFVAKKAETPKLDGPKTLVFDPKTMTFKEQ